MYSTHKPVVPVISTKEVSRLEKSEYERARRSRPERHGNTGAAR